MRVRILLVLAALLAAASFPPTPARAAPAVAARSWIVMDAETGIPLAAADPHQRAAVASLTKVMTALLAVERGDPDQTVRIVPADLVGEATAGLRAGTDVQLDTLLHGLLMRSGNDAAMAVARAVGGSPGWDDPASRERFVGWMNERAVALGLHDSAFVNPHGLDAPGHYSSAYDLAIITRAALAQPRFVAPFGARVFAGEGFHYEHGNKLPERYDGVVGGKTGWTGDAGRCLIEVAERDGRRLIVVLLGSTFERWYDDAAALLDYGWTLPLPATTPARADAVFAWWQERFDGPIARGLAARSWTWGAPIGGGATYQPYSGAPDERRAVRYFDKGRMEIDDPRAQVDSGWYVTGGRLAWELITGRRQIGAAHYEEALPAAVPLAGDPIPGTPTYAVLRPLLDAPATAVGDRILTRLAADGSRSADLSLAHYDVRAGPVVPGSRHGVASVFQAWLATPGPVVVGGAIVEAPVLDPPFAVTGLPITEAYWVRVPLDGDSRDVLVQCFERRCLTYAPANPVGWQVEMGNTGAHYLRWITPPVGERLPPSPSWS